LKEGENVVGRDSSCDIVVKDTSISRRHAVITVGPDAVTVKDLASKNRTMVDNKIIEAEVSLTDGSEVCFGSVKARLREKS
jgi:pSer/pThr/pTyr-binding forkhead associated (FHA) protein